MKLREYKFDPASHSPTNPKIFPLLVNSDEVEYTFLITKRDADAAYGDGSRIDAEDINKIVGFSLINATFREYLLYTLEELSIRIVQKIFFMPHYRRKRLAYLKFELETSHIHGDSARIGWRRIRGNEYHYGIYLYTYFEGERQEPLFLGMVRYGEEHSGTLRKIDLTHSSGFEAHSDRSYHKSVTLNKAMNYNKAYVYPLEPYFGGNHTCEGMHSIYLKYKFLGTMKIVRNFFIRLAIILVVFFGANALVPVENKLLFWTFLGIFVATNVVYSAIQYKKHNP